MVLIPLAFPFIAIHTGFASHFGHTTERAHKMNPPTETATPARSRVIHQSCSMN
jgi:hypothetical protein